MDKREQRERGKEIMPFEFICRRCNHRGYTATRSFINFVIADHFKKSHKRLPKPYPKEEEKCTVANPFVVNNDYYICLLEYSEYYEIQRRLGDPLYWKAVNSKL